MPKRAEKQLKDKKTPVAKPGAKPIDVEAGFAQTLARFPKVIARLGK